MAQSTNLSAPRKEARSDLFSFDPFGSFSPFGMSFGRMLDDFWGRRGPAELDRLIAPVLDLREDAGSFTISTELPGIKKDDVKIQFEDGVLTISGEKKEETETKDSSFHRKERRYGAFHRAITLPSGADVDAAEAQFKDGVLEVRIPKLETAKPKTVKVK